MPHPFLSSAWLKFRRAEKQGNDIKGRLIKAFDSDQNPVQVHKNHQTGEVRYVWAEGNPNFWDELSLNIGEFLHNLRSSLDHIAWGFARVGATRDGRAHPYRRTTFPISDDPSDWPRALRQDLRDVPGYGRAFIKRFQPHQSRHKTFNGTLLLIHKLNNTDKHSLLNVTVTALTRAEYKTMVPGTDRVRRIQDITIHDAKPGTELFSAVYPQGMEIDLEFSWAFIDYIKEPRENIELKTRLALPRFLRVVRFIMNAAEREIYWL